jgi:hypothetical protein
MRIYTALALALLSTLPGTARTISETEARQAIIRESLAAYPGNCPCPYNTDRAGRSCGRRSAYSRPGGYAPICYDSDVSADMVRQYRSSH